MPISTADQSVLPPIEFDAPYSATNFYFKYYSNRYCHSSSFIITFDTFNSYLFCRSYVCCAESEVVKIGPVFNIKVEKCVENKNQSNLFSVTLRVGQEGMHIHSHGVNYLFKIVPDTYFLLGGKVCPNLWIALYASGVQSLKNFVSYQYCTVNTDVVFSIPKSGAWTFKLFPFKYYEPILSFPYFIDGIFSSRLVDIIFLLTLKGEDKVQMQVVGNQFVISYHIKTLSLDQKPWIGIYEYFFYSFITASFLF